MRYLGVASMGHDASVAVVHGNEIIFAAHQERSSGVKNDGNVTKELIDRCRVHGFDEVVWYESPGRKAWRQVTNGQISEGIRTLGVKSHLRELQIIEPVSFVGHHESHAAGGFFTSGFDDAVTIVCDAIGESDTISVWFCENNKMKQIHGQTYPHSLGLFYSAITQRVGKKPNEEEFIVMGMAAFGDPKRLKPRMLDELVSIDRTNIPKFITRRNLHRGIRDWAPELTTEQDFMDIAAAAQEITEDFMVAIAARFNHLSDNLVLSGGVALNCRANSEIKKKSGFRNLWIMPNPGDAGSSLGAIAAKTRQHLNFNSVYLGTDIKHDTDWNQVLVELLKGEVIGVATGRAEWGPRSLGNRSILADPRGDQMKDRVNSFKRREKFRPFAPLILQEEANNYFEMPIPTTPYMQFTAPCRYPNEFPAICHIDGTSRVQTINEQQNKEVYDLLKAFHRETGCPMLLNTSMNIKGKPLVDTWEQALEFQKETGIKVY